MRDEIWAPAVTVDEGLSRRAKALACTAPLHDLDARKGLIEWAEAKTYLMAEIALYTIDQVAITMDFDTGAGHQQIMDRVQQFVARQAPHRASKEHARVTAWVLESLINLGDVDRAFRRPYGAVDPDGIYRVRTFDFKLIEERRDSTGKLYLRASHEALNVLVGALDTDVESAQIAAEVKLDNLIRRGRLTDAKRVAEQAQLLTIQYGDMIRVQLDATKRNVQAVDWREKVPELLDNALTHVEERVKAERAISKYIAEARDEAEDPVRKSHAAELVDIVEDCVRRHIKLHTRLIGARDLFREQQDRQQFSSTLQRQTLDPYGHLLIPTLDLPVADVSRLTNRYFTESCGPVAQDVPDLAALVPLLLRPAPERTRFAEEVLDPNLETTEEQKRFTDRQWEQANAILDLPDEVRTLSGLLAEAATLDPELPELVALLALQAYSPQTGTALRRSDHQVLLAVHANTSLDSQGFKGDDLLLTTARLLNLSTDEHQAQSTKHTGDDR
ncbi:hypothetical protein [Nocardiopsis sp. CNS-639]|uniref:hypothetical protein n=1 Tax=Nocardiopsis sp. CNS-639 TaxID=1169153 RepID=UPI00068850EF|nr:hypothetical protein [Nocardiopsis sp. CNS-639]